MAWKTIKSETLMSDKYCTVKRSRVQLPDGAEINDFFTVTIPDAALVVAITSDNNIILKREYRFACGEDILECPAGIEHMINCRTPRGHSLKKPGNVESKGTA